MKVPTTMKIRVSRTIQVSQYCPLTIETEEVFEVPKGTTREEYIKAKRLNTKSAGDQIYKMIELEADRYRE